MTRSPSVASWMATHLTQDQIDRIIDRARDEDCAAATRSFLNDETMPENNFTHSGFRQALNKFLRDGTRIESHIDNPVAEAGETFEEHLLKAPSEQQANLPRYGRATTTDIGGGSFAVDLKDVRSDALSQEPTERQADLLKLAGYDPEFYTIEGATRESRWQQARAGEDEPIMLEAHRFQVVPRTDNRPGWRDEDIKNLAQEFAGISRPPRTEGQDTLVWHVSDLQLGKRSNGGANGLETPLAHVVDALDQVRRHLISNQGRYADVVVAMTGDCVEGTASQGGRSQGYQTPLTEAEQTRVLRRLIMQIVDSLAPYARELVIGVVNGNHDRRSGQVVDTRPGDGIATEAAIAVSDMLEIAGLGDHVKVIVPHPDQSWLVYHAHGGSFVLAHGHQWRRGKARNWWQEGALADSDVAGADILLHGHEHEKSFSITGPRTICCAGTIDGGSAWYSDRTGGTWQQPQSDLYSVADGRVVESRIIYTDATTGHRRAA